MDHDGCAGCGGGDYGISAYFFDRPFIIDGAFVCAAAFGVVYDRNSVRSSAGGSAHLCPEIKSDGGGGGGAKGQGVSEEVRGCVYGDSRFGVNGIGDGAEVAG